MLVWLHPTSSKRPLRWCLQRLGGSPCLPLKQSSNQDVVSSCVVIVWLCCLEFQSSGVSSRKFLKHGFFPSCQRMDTACCLVLRIQNDFNQRLDQKHMIGLFCLRIIRWLIGQFGNRWDYLAENINDSHFTAPGPFLLCSLYHVCWTFSKHQTTEIQGVSSNIWLCVMAHNTLQVNSATRIWNPRTGGPTKTWPKSSWSE